MAKHDPRSLRCLAIRQPFAWAVCAGIKRVENRTIKTPYRGLVAILASSKRTYVNHMVRDFPAQKLRADFFAFSAIIGVARLVDVVEMNPSLEGDPDAVGPWCWIFDEGVLLPEPIPSRGKLNLYSLTAAESEAVRRQLPGLKPEPLSPEARDWEAAFCGEDADPLCSIVQSVDLLGLRGRAYWELGKFDDSIRNYDEALAIEPDDDELLVGRIYSYLGKKDFKKAISDCTKIIRADPDEVHALLLRRMVYQRVGQPKLAESDLQAALALDPEAVEDWEAELAEDEDAEETDHPDGEALPRGR